MKKYKICDKGMYRFKCYIRSSGLNIERYYIKSLVGLQITSIPGWALSGKIN